MPDAVWCRGWKHRVHELKLVESWAHTVPHEPKLVEIGLVEMGFWRKLMVFLIEQYSLRRRLIKEQSEILRRQFGALS